MLTTSSVTTVALDLRMVEGSLHGIARYALELSRRLPALEPRWRFVGITAPAGLPKNLGPLTPQIECVPCPAPFLSPLEQPALAWSLARLRPALFHATSFSLPALWPGRLAATLHDANHLALADNYGRSRAAYYQLVVRPRAASAHALITVSEFSRRELARYLRLPEQRFQVILEGVSETFSPPSSQATLVEFQKRHRLPARYVLATGNPKPHKNLRVLHALAEQSPLPLVLLAGKDARGRLGFPSSTLELVDVPEKELPLLYAGAAVTLFPSRYEGFGFPALEAMACGSPLIAASAGSLPEIVGEAGLLVSPDAPEEWREQALRVLREPALAASLRQRGVERAARYRWDTCAEQTLAVYRRALESPAR